MPLLLLLLFLPLLLANNINPYHVLGLPRNARDEDIKKAYRDKAKLWHPDKNPNAEAQAKFVQIQEAYEILIDETKRRQYDRTGSVDNNPRGGGDSYYRYSSPRYHDYTMSSGSSAATKLTSMNFDHLVYSSGGDDEIFRLWLIFAFSKSSPMCKKVNKEFETLAKTLKGVIHFGRINVDYEYEITRRLGIRSVPSIFGVTVRNGKARTFWAPINSRSSPKEYSSRAILEWGSSLIEKHVGSHVRVHLLTPKIEDKQQIETLKSNYKNFLQTSRQTYPERTIVLIISSRLDDAHIIFKVAAERYKDYATFAHICVSCLDEHLHPAAVAVLSPELERAFEDQRWDPKSPALIIQREPPTKDLVIVDGVTPDLDAILKLLKPRIHHVIPKLHAENFYQFCYSDSVPCVILFGKSRSEVRERYIRLASPASPLYHIVRNSGAEPGQQQSESIQLGWINSYQQQKFISFFKSNPSSNAPYCYESPYERTGEPEAVLLRARDAQYLVYYGTKNQVGESGEKEELSPREKDLSNWILQAIGGECELVDLKDKKKRGIGIPFLVADPEATLSPSNSFQFGDLTSGLSTLIGWVGEGGGIIFAMMLLILVLIPRNFA